MAVSAQRRQPTSSSHSSEPEQAALYTHASGSGVAPVAAVQLSASDIDLRAPLPDHRSPIEEIVVALRDLGGRYQRYVHQDEFGPTRAERMAALRPASREPMIAGMKHRTDSALAGRSTRRVRCEPDPRERIPSVMDSVEARQRDR